MAEAPAPSYVPADAVEFGDQERPVAHRLVLMRHGQSEFNADHLFTGWTDAELTEQGEREARQAGKLIAMFGFHPDIVFTSVLERAIHTANYALAAMEKDHVTVDKDWRLNERHYGALQTFSKEEAAEDLWGAEQVQTWRRSWDAQPPPLDRSDQRHPANDPVYTRDLKIPESELPGTESLQDCVKRVLPCWNEKIVPQIEAGKEVMVAAHGNTLRGIMKELEEISEEDIVTLQVPTGAPVVYELDQDLKPVRRFTLGQKKIQEPGSKNPTLAVG